MFQENKPMVAEAAGGSGSAETEIVIRIEWKEKKSEVSKNGSCNMSCATQYIKAAKPTLTIP